MVGRGEVMNSELVYPVPFDRGAAPQARQLGFQSGSAAALVIDDLRRWIQDSILHLKAVLCRDLRTVRHRWSLLHGWNLSFQCVESHI